MTQPLKRPGPFRAFWLYLTKKCRNAVYVYKTRGIKTFWQKLENEIVFRGARVYDTCREYLRKKPEGSVFTNRRKVLPVNPGPMQKHIVSTPKPRGDRDILAGLLRDLQGEIRGSRDIRGKL